MKVWTSLVLFILLFDCAQAQSDWTQWGGPNRDFVINSKGLVECLVLPGDGAVFLVERDQGLSLAAKREDDRVFVSERAAGVAAIHLPAAEVFP